MTPEALDAIEQLKQPQPPDRRGLLIEIVVDEGGTPRELDAIAIELDATQELRAALADVFSIQAESLLFQMSCLAVKDDAGVQLAVADGFGALADSFGNMLATLKALAGSQNVAVREAAKMASADLVQKFRESTP